MAVAIWVGHDRGSVVAAELSAHESERSRGARLTSLAYQPDGHVLRTVVPTDRPDDLSGRPVSDGQWDYYRYYTTHFDASRRPRCGSRSIAGVDFSIG